MRDDGAGFDPAAGRAGFGLIGMRERVALVRGTLVVESAPGAGTTLRASIPTRRRDARDRLTGADPWLADSSGSTGPSFT